MALIGNDAKTIKTLFRSKKIATMHELQSVLKTDVNMTVYRKLKELSYITSYSDSGKYYTLSDIPKFDDNGLWTYDSVMFSIHGNLQQTVKAFVDNSNGGYTANELKTILKVEVKEPLLIIFRKNQIFREKISGLYVYFTKELRKRKNQLLKRNEPKIEIQAESHIGDTPTEKVKSAIWKFFSILDEKQRRLFAGLESIKIGYGGDKKVASFLNMDPHTVAKGRTELLEQRIEMDRMRKKGGGRIPVEKKARK